MYYKAQVDNKTPSNTDFSRVTNDSELWAPLTPFLKSLLIRSIAPVTRTGLNGVYLGFVVRARVAGSRSGSQAWRLDRKSGEQLGL